MESDYNPVDHRSPEQLKTSSFAVFMHLLKAAAGSGILFLPYAFKKTGYLAALYGSIIVGIICIHTAVTTVRCSQILCRRSRVPALGFAETAEASFKFGPEPLPKYARAFAVLTNIVVCFIQYQTATVYMLYVVSSLRQVIEYSFDWGMDLRLYVLLFLPIFCLFSLMPNFSFLTPFSVAGTIFLVCGLTTTFGYFLRDFESPSRLPTITDYEQLGVYCSVFLFSLYNMSMLMPLENTMRQPDRMAILLAVGMIINAIVTVAFGFLGYNKYEDSCDTVIKNLPLDELPAQMVKIAISLSVMFTFGLQYFVPVSIIWPIIAEKLGDKLVYELLFRIGGVFVIALVCILLPHLAPLLGLFSAVSMTTLMMLIPVLIETSTKWNDPGTIKHIFILTKNFIIFVVWLLILFFGARESIRAIITEKSQSEADICK